MKRSEFISNFSVGIAALCTTCMVACSKSDVSEELPPKVTDPPLSFTIDLNNELKSIGDFKLTKGVLVVRTAITNDASSFVAYESACPHQASTLEYFFSVNQFICPTHGSKFTISGEVIQGPATKNLKKFKIAISQNILTISEKD